MKAVAKVLDEFMEKIIDEHVQSKDSRTKDFVNLMLSFIGSEETNYRTDRGHINAVILASYAMNLRKNQLELRLIISVSIQVCQ
ncbi:hypothetical protein ACOSQ3_022252 [Xanthoceras sorbifolium]